MAARVSTPRYATATPRAAPATASSTDSVSNWRIRRVRLAPTEARTASSCWRAVPRASSRMEALAQPMISSASTAANSSTSVPAKRPSTSSFNVTITTRISGRKKTGSSFLNWSTRVCSSAAAAAWLVPGFSLIKDSQ